MPHLLVLNHRSIVAQFASILLWSLTIAVSGCSDGEPKPTGSQASVSGSVTNNGANVTPETSVVFFCKEKNATAVGKVDSLGKFALTPGVGSIGIPAGRYQVTVRPPDPPAPEIGTKEYEDIMAGKAKKPEPAKDIPLPFGDFETSGIVLEVKAGENKFDLDLAKLAEGVSSEPIQNAQ